MRFSFKSKSEQPQPWHWVGLIICVATACPVTAEEFPAVDCVVSPNVIVDLSSPVPGVLDEVLVERSEFVGRGQVVARLAAGVEVAGVNLAIARTELDPDIRASEVNLEFDQKRKERFDSLYGNEVIAIQNKEEAEREAQLSIWNLQRAKDRQKVRVLELRRAEELLAQKTIRSTIEGVIVARFKSAGEYVEDQPIVRIAQLNPLRVEAIMPMKYFGQIRTGMIAIVHPETMREPREATVTVVDPLGDPASGTFGVRLSLPNPDYSVPAGMKCEMKFIALFEPDSKTTVINERTAMLSIQDEADPRTAYKAESTWNSLAESIWNSFALSMSESVDSGVEFDDSTAYSISSSELGFPIRSD